MVWVFVVMVIAMAVALVSALLVLVILVHVGSSCAWRLRHGICSDTAMMTPFVDIVK
jgi:hypothetical protein